MPCFHPIPAWRNKQGTVQLNKRLEEKGFHDNVEALRIPCGNCLGCVTSKAKEWAVRCTLEAEQHSASCWATLTYNDDNLPPTLSKRHVQLFHKLLRRRLTNLDKTFKLRTFYAGEYGETTHRPHYHTILFGLAHTNEAHIQAAWPHGNTQTDKLEPAAISYVAGYTAKKITFSGKDKFQRCNEGEHDIERVNPHTGEVLWFKKIYQAPFIEMSTKPYGIGGHARQYWQDWHTYARVQGNTIPVPRYLKDSWEKNVDPFDRELHEFQQYLRQRKKSILGEYTPEAIEAKLRVAEARHKQRQQGHYL